MTDTALENKALKMMTKIASLSHTITYSACDDKEGLTYNWDAIVTYCRMLIEDVHDLKDAATELMEAKA